MNEHPNRKVTAFVLCHGCLRYPLRKNPNCKAHRFGIGIAGEIFIQAASTLLELINSLRKTYFYRRFPTCLSLSSRAYNSVITRIVYLRLSTSSRSWSAIVYLLMFYLQLIYISASHSATCGRAPFWWAPVRMVQSTSSPARSIVIIKIKYNKINIFSQ